MTIIYNIDQYQLPRPSSTLEALLANFSKIPHCCLHQSEARKLSSWPELTNRRAGWRVHPWGKDDYGGGGTAALPPLHHLLIHQLLVIAGTALSKTSACSELLTVMMMEHFFVSKIFFCDKTILFLTIVARVQGLPSRGNQSHKQGEAMQDNPPIGQLTINALQYSRLYLPINCIWL